MGVGESGNKIKNVLCVTLGLSTWKCDKARLPTNLYIHVYLPQ